jgi:hypothetical protein
MSMKASMVGSMHCPASHPRAWSCFQTRIAAPRPTALADFTGGGFAVTGASGRPQWTSGDRPLRPPLLPPSRRGWDGGGGAGRGEIFARGVRLG